VLDTLLSHDGLRWLSHGFMSRSIQPQPINSWSTSTKESLCARLSPPRPTRGLRRAAVSFSVSCQACICSVLTFVDSSQLSELGGILYTTLCPNWSAAKTQTHWNTTPGHNWFTAARIIQWNISSYVSCCCCDWDLKDLLNWFHLRVAQTKTQWLHFCRYNALHKAEQNFIKILKAR